MSTPLLLTKAQIRYVRKAAKLRAKLSNKSLAAKYGISVRAITDYVNGSQKATW